MNTLTIYPLSNYSFATKEAQIDEDPSVNARLQRLEDEYEQFGIRRTVEGLMIVHEHGHPHVLLLQVANSFFKLPGDHLKPGEGDIDGLKRRMQTRLGPEGSEPQQDTSMTNGWDEKVAGDWEIADSIGQFYRPNFESFMYPYIPAHISKPKEVKTWYLIQMSERKILTVPKNMKLIALPLFELYDNSVRYGPQLAAIPHLLSRINFIFEN